MVVGVNVLQQQASALSPISAINLWSDTGFCIGLSVCMFLPQRGSPRIPKNMPRWMSSGSLCTRAVDCRQGSQASSTGSVKESLERVRMRYVELLAGVYLEVDAVNRAHASVLTLMNAAASPAATDLKWKHLRMHFQRLALLAAPIFFLPSPPPPSASAVPDWIFSLVCLGVGLLLCTKAL